MTKLLKPVWILTVLMVVTLIGFSRPLIRGDGVAYLAWADTLLIDHDLDLTNQVEKLRYVNDESKVMYDEDQGKWVNVFPFGVAILQAPFYLLGHFFVEQGWLNLNPEYFRQNQGVELPYSLWVMFGANLMALAASLLAYQVGRKLCDAMSAAVVAFLIFFGTPLFYYSTVAPMHSHNSGAFTFAAFLWLLARNTSFGNSVANKDRLIPWGRWVLLGVLAGLTVLIRWQVLLAFLPAWGVLAWEKQWKGFIIAGIAATLTVLPLPLVWHQMYGEWLLVPYDAAKDTTFLSLTWDKVWWVCQHTLKSSPVLFLSLLGLPYLWRFNRAWGAMAVGMIGLQILINGAAYDVWAGEAYGMRRMSELYALYVVMACAGVAQLVEWGRGKKRLSLQVVRVGLLLICTYCLLYVIAFFNYTWTNPDGIFHNEPQVMISFLFERPRVYRWQVLKEVLEVHVGPSSWSKPGP